MRFKPEVMINEKGRIEQLENEVATLKEVVKWNCERMDALTYILKVHMSGELPDASAAVFEQLYSSRLRVLHNDDKTVGDYLADIQEFAKRRP